MDKFLLLFFDDGGRMDARGAHRLRRRENLRRGHARKIRIFHADDGTWRIALPVFRQKNGRGLGGSDEFNVLGILAEAQISLAGLFKAAASDKLDILALENAADNRGKFASFHLQSLLALAGSTPISLSMASVTLNESFE